MPWKQNSCASTYEACECSSSSSSDSNFIEGAISCSETRDADEALLLKAAGEWVRSDEYPLPLPAPWIERGSG